MLITQLDTGKTAIYKTYESASYILDDWKHRISRKLSKKLKLIKMTISDELCIGTYGSATVYLGETINSIEEKIKI